MTDTPEHIHQLQVAIYNRMSAGERITVCLRMATEGRRSVEKRMQRQHPDWSAGEIAVATFRLLYRDDFTPEKLADICESIRAYHLHNP